jgi:thioredoxin-dependent peroxiredoxin
MNYPRIHLIRLLWLIALCCCGALSVRSEPPKTGDRAPDFSLKTLDGETVQLSKLTSKSRVVVVVLRGWPGYQCPLCTQQVHDLVKGADDLKAREVKMVFVYPGPAQALQAHAAEFLKDKTWPKDFLFVTDPDYTMVKAYDVRWDAKNETAYPSTFVIDRENKVQFAKVSKEHGGRIKLKDLLAELDSRK